MTIFRTTAAFLFFFVTLTACGFQAKSVQARGDLISAGYRQWDKYDVYFKLFGDTAVYFSIKNNVISSKTVFIKSNSVDSTLEFLRAKGYIELQSVDSVNNVYLFNQSNGRVFRFHRLKSHVSLTQDGGVFSPDVGI